MGCNGIKRDSSHPSQNFPKYLYLGIIFLGFLQKCTIFPTVTQGCDTGFDGKSRKLCTIIPTLLNETPPTISG